MSDWHVDWDWNCNQTNTNTYPYFCVICVASEKLFLLLRVNMAMWIICKLHFIPWRKKCWIPSVERPSRHGLVFISDLSAFSLNQFNSVNVQKLVCGISYLCIFLILRFRSIQFVWENSISIFLERPLDCWLIHDLQIPAW